MRWHLVGYFCDLYHFPCFCTWRAKSRRRSSVSGGTDKQSLYRHLRGNAEIRLLKSTLNFFEHGLFPGLIVIIRGSGTCKVLPAKSRWTRHKRNLNVIEQIYVNRPERTRDDSHLVPQGFSKLAFRSSYNSSSIVLPLLDQSTYDSDNSTRTVTWGRGHLANSRSNRLVKNRIHNVA